MSVDLTHSEMYTLRICSVHPTVHVAESNSMKHHRVDHDKLRRLSIGGYVSVTIDPDLWDTAHVRLTAHGRDILDQGVDQ